VLEHCNVDFVIDVLFINVRKYIVDPLAHSRKLPFGCKDEDFVWGSSTFDAQTPGLFKDGVGEGGLINVGVGVARVWDIKGGVLEIPDWNCHDTVNEGIIITDVIGVGFRAEHMNCSSGNEYSKMSIKVHGVSELQEKFFQEA